MGLVAEDGEGDPVAERSPCGLGLVGGVAGEVFRLAAPDRGAKDLEEAVLPAVYPDFVGLEAKVIDSRGLVDRRYTTRSDFCGVRDEAGQELASGAETRTVVRGRERPTVE